MISLEQYWMGRDKIYASEFTPQIQANGLMTVQIVNEILGQFAAETGIVLSILASGWRPLAINCATQNAADHSLHIKALACDMQDTPNRDFARWCCKNQHKLSKVWIERFEWTMRKDGKPWVHMQIVPTVSGRKFFIPSTAAAFAPRLPEQNIYNC